MSINKSKHKSVSVMTRIPEDLSYTSARRLTSLAAPTDMLHVKALHMADKQPYIFEDRWIVHETTPEILDVDLSRESANEWLIRNRPYSDCEVRFLAKNATQQEAELLASDVDEALFVMERTTWINSAPITMVRAIAKAGYQLLAKAN